MSLFLWGRRERKRKFKTVILPHTVWNYIPFILVVIIKIFQISCGFFNKRITELSLLKVYLLRVRHNTTHYRWFTYNGSNQHGYTKNSFNYQIWAYFPNMVMASLYGHALQTVKLKQYNVFFILTYLWNVQKSITFEILAYCPYTCMVISIWLIFIGFCTVKVLITLTNIIDVE